MDVIMELIDFAYPGFFHCPYPFEAQKAAIGQTDNLLTTGKYAYSLLQ